METCDLLEEPGIDYDLTYIDLLKRTKAPDYVALNPNGRIPTIVDRSNNDFVVFESGAIPGISRKNMADANAKSETLQWLMSKWAVLVQSWVKRCIFNVSQQNKVRSILRSTIYRRITAIIRVLNTRLPDRRYLVNDEFTIADAITPKARAYYWANVSVEGLAHLQSWFAGYRCAKPHSVP